MDRNEMDEYKIVDRVLDSDLETEYGFKLKLGSYKTSHKGKIVEHALIYKGNIENPLSPILLRINSACYTSDIFSCSKCDCNWQLYEAMKLISQQGGLIIYHFHHEGRGAGFTTKVRERILTDRHQATTYDAFVQLSEKPDQRKFISSIVILNDLNIKAVKLITNNPEKKQRLIGSGIDVTEIVPIVGYRKEWQEYLRSKQEQFGHYIHL